MDPLEHLRPGRDEPVQFLELNPDTIRVFISYKSHVLLQNIYSARMEMRITKIHLSWTVNVPRKDESIA